MTTEERRAYRRFNIVLPAQYKFAAFQERATQSSTLDISAGGLKLWVKDKPFIGDEIHLTIDLPESKRVKLAAKIIWVKMIQDDKYETGVKLADTKSEDGKIFMDFYSQQLLSFIESNKDQGQSRIVQ